MFKSKADKEFDKKMAIKKTLNEFDRQVKKLESQKTVFIDQGKEALNKGLTQQFNLALQGLKMTLLQQKKVQAMSLNLKLITQMKDITMMTNEFLKTMSNVSKDMIKLTNEKQFSDINKQFETAMRGVQQQADSLEVFMENTEQAYEENTVDPDSINDEELKKLFFGDQNVSEGDVSFEDFVNDVLTKK